MNLAVNCNKYKQLLKTLTILLIVIMISVFFSGCKDEQKEYINSCESTVQNKFNDNNYSYLSISTEFNKSYGEWKQYFLIVEVSETVYQNYSDLYDVCLFFDKMNFENKNGVKISFVQYIKCDGYLYNISSTDTKISANDLLYKSGEDVIYECVYDNIVAKAGVDLTDREKATIYGYLDDYLTAVETVNGKTKYKYTEEYSFNMTAERFNVTVEFLENEIWNYDVMTLYQRYKYGK